jgi:hypothetical protein
MDVPWHSKASKNIRITRLLITLASLLLLYIETMPSFNKYGTDTRMCKQIVSFHCAKVTDTLQNRKNNPVCFDNPESGYKGCRNIAKTERKGIGTDFMECGFPNKALGFTCVDHNTTTQNAELDAAAVDIQYEVEQWWVSENANHNSQQLYDGQMRRISNHTVKICDRIQCIENNIERDYSFDFQIGETILVSFFVIELLSRLIASTRSAPMETTDEKRVRRSLHWTWSRLLKSVCGHCGCSEDGCCCASCIKCKTCICGDDYITKSSPSKTISSSVSTHEKDGLEKLVEDKHEDEPVIYGLWEWSCQLTNQLDTIAVISAAVEVIWVPLTFGSGFRYEVWGVGADWFDPAVFRISRVLISARFISMERFFDDTTAIRKTISAVAVKLFAPVFFLFVFVLIMASLFLWFEVTISADLYACTDFSIILNNGKITKEFFEANCRKCQNLDNITYDDPFLGVEERYNGTCRRIVVPRDSTTPHIRIEPFVQTFAEALWFMFVTVTTTGYGRDGVPTTYLGRIIMCITSIMGTLYLAMPLSVVSAKFFEIFTKMQEAAKHKEEMKRKMTMKRLHALTDEIHLRSSPSWNKQASKLTFKMIVTLKLLAHRVRRRNMIRAPLTISQQHLILDYEDQIFVIHEQLWDDSIVIKEEKNESEEKDEGGTNIEDNHYKQTNEKNHNHHKKVRVGGRIVQLAALESLRNLHMRLMYSILRQLGRGENLHETMRVSHAASDDAAHH